MVTPELKWPTTNFTPSPTNLLATETPCLGSDDVVADARSTIFWPRMPPAALMSSTACSAPFLSCAPNAALGPVIGPATPSLIWARRVAGHGGSAAERQAKSTISFMQISLFGGWTESVRLVSRLIGK